MDDKVKVLEVGDGYKVLEWLYNDIPITFRVSPNKVEVRFDDNFALANGYISKRAMISHFAKRNNMGVFDTDWVQVLEDGEFYLESRLRLVNALPLPTYDDVN